MSARTDDERDDGLRHYDRRILKSSSEQTPPTHGPSTCLALSEACTNVITHAATEDEYEVQVRVDDQKCVISVKNTGNGFDAGQVTGIMPDPDSARGRGVAIMHALMDTVDFNSDSDGGTVVRLARNLTLRADAPVGLRDLRRRST